MGLFLGDSEPSKIFVGDTPISKVFVGNQKVRPAPIKQSFVLDNIPTTDTNEYIDVSKSGYTIQQVKCSFSFMADTYYNTYFSISSNNSNTHRYGLEKGYSEDTFRIRGRLNGTSDSVYRQVPGFVANSLNTVVFTINRNGNCNITCNGISTDYTARNAELNVIQTIMNLSNMNCYSSQYGNAITGNEIDIEVTYN